jgi:enoyl-[acyl-carrier-protein] reductase (NADH)
VKRIIAVSFAGFLLFAGAASAATPAQRIASLEKQVKALTATVKKQQAVINCIAKSNNKCVTLKSGFNSVSGALNATIYVAFCSIGVTADAIQSTWATLDQANHTTLFGPQQTISDGNTCGPLQITRQGIRNPPTPSVFSALTGLLSRRTASFRLG